MKRRDAWALLALGGFIVSAFSGCGDDEGGETTPASGGSTAASTAVVVGPATNSVTSTGSGPPPTDLGKACTSDGDCQVLGDMSLICFLPTDNTAAFGGGPVNGYCSKGCGTAADCPGLGSACVNGECYLGCTIGPSLTSLDQALNPDKCHGREDVRCTPDPQTGEEYCVPTCGHDAQCAGRQCDPRTGQCVDSATTGRADGEGCNENAMNHDGCAGFCQRFNGNVESICTTACVLGGALNGDDCGGGLSSGLCTYSPSGYGAGDFGRCAPACTQHDRCDNPDWWCFLPNSVFPQGYCFTGTSCPNGDSDCGNTFDDSVCVDTPNDGPKCLQVDTNDCAGQGNGGYGPNGCQLLFPFGAGTGGGGGTGGSGGSGGTGGTGGTGGAGGGGMGGAGGGGMGGGGGN